MILRLIHGEENDLLDNGEKFPELDHVNLSGLLTPRLFRYVAKRATYNTSGDFIQG